MTKTKNEIVLPIVFAGVLFVCMMLVSALYTSLYRGPVTQHYWYCNTFNGWGGEGGPADSGKPHHYGHRPLIPFWDHPCGDKELEEARYNGYLE